MQRSVRAPIPDDVRRQLLLESRGICCLCHRSRIQHLHHLRESAKGGKSVGTNLAGVCATCHNTIHDGPDSEASLRAARNDWLAECQNLLARIIQTDAAVEPRAQELYHEYFGLNDLNEVQELTRRLRGFLGSGSLFDNFVNIRRHDVRKEVDLHGNCWTHEEQRFRPFTVLTKRNVQFSGACPATFRDTRFAAEVKLDGKWTTPQWEVAHDTSQFKILSLKLPRTLQQHDDCILRFSYYWPTTWDFVDYLYTYDVLTWIQRLTYQFSLPQGYNIRSVTTGAIDLFGHEWARKDRVNYQDNEFVCVTKHLLPFTSWKVRYRAERRR